MRIQLSDELLAISEQTDEATELTPPVTADIFAFQTAEVRKNEETVERSDKGLGRSKFGLARGGNSAPDFEVVTHLLLAAANTPVLASPIESLIKGAMGGDAVVVNTTISDISPTAADFNVASATGIQIGDPLTVDVGGTFEMRPVTGIAGVNLTFDPPFSAAPADAAVVKARVFRLASLPKYYTIVNFLREQDLTDTTLSQKLIGAVINELEIDFNQAVIQLTARGLAGSYSRTAIPAIPTLPSFSEEAQARNFGGMWVDATPFSAFEGALSINNNAEQLAVPFGSQNPDGIVFGQRDVGMNLLVEGTEANETLLLDKADAKTEFKLFGHAGDGEGTLFGFNMPVVNLSVDPYEKGSSVLQLRFSNTRAEATSAESELVIAIG